MIGRISIHKKPIEEEETNMSLEENKALAHKFHKEMLEQARDDLIDELISPDFVAHVPGLPHTGKASRASGTPTRTR